MTPTSGNESATPISSVLTAQIIVGAIISSLLALTVVAYFLIKPDSQPGELPKVFLWLVPAVALVALVVFPLMRTALMSRVHSASVDRSEETGSRFRSAFQTLTLIRAALIEAPGLLAVIGYMVAGDTRLLWFTAAAIALLILQFPSEQKYQEFIDSLPR